MDNLYIRIENQEAHQDIQKDLLKQKNGLFTFILKVHEGKVSDYVYLQNKRFAQLNKGGDSVSRHD